MLMKRAADIAEALYSVPRPHSQLQALPSSPAHGSVMGISSYPPQLGISLSDPQSASQGEYTHTCEGDSDTHTHTCERDTDTHTHTHTHTCEGDSDTHTHTHYSGTD